MQYIHESILFMVEYYAIQPGIPSFIVDNRKSIHENIKKINSIKSLFILIKKGLYLPKVDTLDALKALQLLTRNLLINISYNRRLLILNFS